MDRIEIINDVWLWLIFINFSDFLIFPNYKKNEAITDDISLCFTYNLLHCNLGWYSDVSSKKESTYLICDVTGELLILLIATGQ